VILLFIRRCSGWSKNYQQAGVAYAVVGGMAVNAHGAGRTTKDLDILMTADGLKRFREQFVGSEYDQSPERSRRFIDRQNQVSIDILVTGHRPGRGQEAPFTFPDPTEASEKWGRCASLLWYN